MEKTVEIAKEMVVMMIKVIDRILCSIVNGYAKKRGLRALTEAYEELISLGCEPEQGYYKNHVKTVLTRYNTLTGVAYKDDPTIFAWELINEPRCSSDMSKKTIQAWIIEMAAYVKSIDRNHLLEAGLEGFYGPSSPAKQQTNPGFQVGTDFISNNQISGIDFATLHSYPNRWLPSSSDQSQLLFLNNWLDAHIQDAHNILQKPPLCTRKQQTQAKFLLFSPLHLLSFIKTPTTFIY